MKKKLLGRKAKIVSDNDNYNRFRYQTLEITHVAYSTEEHPGYDSSMEGQALCDFKMVVTGQAVPFSLYEYEFELV
jgi:hypothetical protein